MFFKVFAIVLLGIFVQFVENIEFVPLEKYDKHLQVQTKNGLLQGRQANTVKGTIYKAYQGIPYAQPPINELRFQSPKPPLNWKGVLNATTDPPPCAQVHIRIDIDLRGQEDCLYLNVYKPKSENNKLAVMVWIYGGAFQDGTSAYSEFSPDYLLDHEVIVITFNYRIGIFGFLSTGDMECPGNYGLKDQNAALKWIKNNIEYFGGDPNRVTIFGESAGAAGAAYHMVSPMSKGLVNGVILQSGCSLSPWSYQRNPRRIAFDVGIRFGISTFSTKRLMYRLKQLSTYELLEASFLPILMNLVQVISDGLPFTPTVEPDHSEAFITSLTYDLFESGNYSEIPVMAGVTSLEAAFLEPFLPILQSALFLYDLSPSLISRMNIPSWKNKTVVGNDIKKHFFKGGSFIAATQDELLQYLSEDLYRRPLLKTVSFLYRRVPVYLYVFSYQGQPGIRGIRELVPEGRHFNGAAHTEDIFYLFQNYSMMPIMSKQDKLVVNKMTKLWTNFAKTGNPTPEIDDIFENVTWPHVNEFQNIPYMEMGDNFEIKQNFYEENFIFWDTLYRKYAERPYLWY